METNDQDILQALREDSERGFRLLMAKYGQAVYWHIRRLVVSHTDAQDAMQETFIRIFRSFGQYRGEDSFRAWVFRIATREALRLIGSRKRKAVSLEDAAEEVSRLTADEYVDYSDLESVRLQQAIRSLPEKQQLTFNLRYYDELSYEEIASITGSTAASAKANYHVAKEKIIQYMNRNN